VVAGKEQREMVTSAAREPGAARHVGGGEGMCGRDGGRGRTAAVVGDAC